ncbi:MAG: TonB-dependent receptor [Tannerella sp.]|jgi:TonB-linked SusC/RagA family outer membrane protein|nr:TonB-dependent receptor [Tannerella sp.]
MINKLIEGMKNAKLNRMKSIVILFAFFLAAGTGMTGASNGSPTETPEPRQAKTRITGTIVDRAGEPVIGANIVEKGVPAHGTVTDTDGKFSLEVASGATLTVSYIGYVTQEVAVGNRSSLQIVLEEDTKALDEVIVVGYGTTSKRKMTASISKVPTEQIENLPSASVVNNLGGRTPGIIVSSTGGGPNSFSVVSIRGGGTPIVVIDGVVSEYNDFRNMAPQDIEELSILKDAAAAAIYGSRAGNGILMVTTKKGANKPLSIDYSYSYSGSRPTFLSEMLGSYDRAYNRNLAFENDGYGPYYAYSEEILEKYRTGSDPYYYPDTDWQKISLKSYAPEASHNLSLRGGDKKNSYYASLSYYDQGTMFKMDAQNYKRYNARVNMVNNFEGIGLKTTTGVSANVTNYRDTYNGGGGIWGDLQLASPMALAYTDLGYYADFGRSVPLKMDPRSGYHNYDYRDFNGLFQAEWSVPYVTGLTLKSISNYRLGFFRQKDWSDMAPVYAIGSDVPLASSVTRSLTDAYSQNRAYTQQFLADYLHEFEGGLTVGAMLGYEFYSYASSNASAYRTGYELPVDQFIAGPTVNMSNGGSESESGRAAYVGRFKADYQAKYMLDVSFRHDGSDWFPKDKRWGTFYALSGAWALSDEAFMSSLKERHVFDLLKLKGSYGIVGLDGGDAGLSRYAYVPGYNLNTDVYVVNGIPRQGFSEGDLVSTDISWYTLKSTNLGVEFASLNDALFGGLDYFRMRTTGYLASPSNVGYTDPLGKNLPNVRSNGEHLRGGIEASLGYRNRIGDLEYELTGSFTYYDELWVVNPGEDKTVTMNPRTRNTHELSYYTNGYRNLGYYTSMADILANPHPTASHDLRPGDVYYEDVNGDGFIDGSDQVHIGKPEKPRANYGLDIDLKYKGFFFNALLMAATGSSRYLGQQTNGSTIQVPYPANRFHLDYWTESNTDAKFPRMLSNQTFNGENNYRTSDFWLISGSYLRLKSMQVGYDFKKRLLKEVNFLSSAKLILSGTNLFSLGEMLKYEIDPESNAENFGYPIQRMYSLTINLGF